MPESKLSARHPIDLPAWQKLKTHYREEMRRASIRDFFANDRDRAKRFTVVAGDICLDYSKNLITDKTRQLLLELACEAGVPDRVEEMFSGSQLNVTEGRSVLHVALRSKISDQVALEVPGVRDVWRVLTEMESFVEAVHNGQHRGATGERLTDIVNIGIGGSDLGPVMASRALKHYWRAGMRFHHVSNVDGTQFADLQLELDPARTLFVVCSKTFTTLETMTNAYAARRWIEDRLGLNSVSAHFAAASTNHVAMDEFGVNKSFRFGFWDWVGGRYSIWSAVGLSLALVIGMDNFRAMLSGARRMDLHFRQVGLEENLPVLMAVMAVWYSNFFGAESQAVLPYDNRLERFPAYLQQLTMESNGKSVRTDGKPVKVATSQLVWGEAGSNAQHSFYQLLHQGTRFVPIDFILPAVASGSEKRQHDLAVANCLAQSEALMDGKSHLDVKSELRAAGMSARESSRLARHKAHSGNRPSSTVLLPALTPETLGQLIALYEHKVFVEGVIFGVNSFDQYGVELGKELASGMVSTVAGEHSYTGNNLSTDHLLKLIAALK